MGSFYSFKISGKIKGKSFFYEITSTIVERGEKFEATHGYKLGKEFRRYAIQIRSNISIYV